MATPPDNPDRLADLLAAYDDALAAGQPSAQPLPWKDLTPEVQARLDGDRHVLDVLEQLWPRSGGDFTPPPVVQALPFAFGRFQARRKLGSGGCGVVFLADDPILGRPVALKVPRPEVLANADLRKRFLREAQTAAVLSHPNIVPVYEASGAGGIIYIAAEFCPGPTLARWRTERPLPGPPRAVAELLAAVADAMGYAHRRGVVHRDLKPSNIMLDVAPDPTRRAPHAVPGNESPAELAAIARLELSAYIPRVTDFGFAKLMERTDDATRTGTVIGTPQYMAPEQAEGRLDRIGPPTDVYALGVILFELLTGRLPIAGANDPDTLRRIVATEPPRLRSLVPTLPRDLESICLKCLEKEPPHRYTDGDALAADLWRFLGGEPIRARAVGPLERGRKWVRRNPLLAGVSASAALACASLVGLELKYRDELRGRNAELTASVGREQRLAAEANRQRAAAIDRTRAARLQAYLTQMRYLGSLPPSQLAATDIQGWDATPDGGDDLRGFEWYYLSRLGRSSRVWRNFTAGVEGVALSDDRRYAAATSANEIRVWSVATGATILAHPAQSCGRPLQFSPDGRWILFDDDNAIVVWDLERGTLVAQFPANRNAVQLLDRQRMLWTAGDDVLLGDPRRPGAARHFRRAGFTPTAAAAAGTTVAVSFGQHNPEAGALVAFDATTGAEQLIASGNDWWHEVRVAPGGRYVAARPAERRVQLFDRQSQSPPAEVGLPNVGMESFRFTARGRFAAAGWIPGDDGNIAVLGEGAADGSGWTTRTVEAGCKLRSLAFDTGGHFLLAGGIDQSVHLFDPTPPEPFTEVRAHGDYEAWGVAVSPDGRTIATSGDGPSPLNDNDPLGHVVRLWDAKTHALKATLRGHTKLVSQVKFLPDGSGLVSASFDGTARRWNMAGQLVRVFPHGGRLRGVAVSPRGDRIVTCGDLHGALVWDAATGAVLGRLTGHEGRVRCVAFSRDGLQVVTGGRDDTLRWWDAVTGKEVRKVPEGNRPSAMALSPDGRTLALGTESGQIFCRDFATGEVAIRGGSSPRRVTAIAWAPDGRTLATAELHGAVRLWNAATGEELFALASGGRTVFDLAFAPSGEFLAGARADGTLIVWDAPSKP